MLDANRCRRAQVDEANSNWQLAGFLGQLAYKIKVHSDVQDIFSFREEKIRALFG